MNSRALNNGVGADPADSEPQIGSVGKKLTINSIAGIVTQFLNLTSRIIITPYVLAYISLQEYGLWTICFVILSYAGLSAFGINNAYVKYIAEYQSSNDYQKINELLSTGIICMSFFCLVLYGLLWISVPFILRKFSIGVEFQDLATFLVLGTAMAFLIETGLGGFKGFLEGLQEIALTSYVFLAMGILEVLLILILLPLGFGVKGMLYAYIVKTILLVSLLALISFRKFNNLKIRFSLINRASLNHLLIFGGKIQFMGLMSIFIETFDRVVSTSLLGLAATGLIEIGRKFPNTARGFSGPAFAPFIPAASYLGGWWEASQWPTLGDKAHKYGSLIIFSTIVALMGILPLHFLFKEPQATFLLKINPFYAMGIIGSLIIILWSFGWTKQYKNFNEYFVGHDVKSIFLKGSRHINLINFTVFTFLIISADRLIFAWLGQGYEVAVTIVVLVSISNLIHQGTGTGTSIFRGINRSGREFEYTIIQFILVLFWIPAFTAYGGVIGAAVGFSMSAILASLYFYWRSFKAFRVSLHETLQITILPGLAPILAGLVIRLILLGLPVLSRWKTIFTLGTLGIFYLCLTLVLLQRWFFTQEEWGLIKGHCQKFIGKLSYRGSKFEIE
jgi:O-antigen/teichoic acid export membrane protein